MSGEVNSRGNIRIRGVFEERERESEQTLPDPTGPMTQMRSPG